MKGYVRVRRADGEVRVPLSVNGFGRSYQELVGRAAASGYDVWTALNKPGKRNRLHAADIARFASSQGIEGTSDERLDTTYTVELFPDLVSYRTPSTGEFVPEKSIPLLYRANATRPREQSVSVVAPDEGFIVPTQDGMFYPGTVIPFETIKDHEMAQKMLESKGIKVVSPYFDPMGLIGIKGADETRIIGRGIGFSIDCYTEFRIAFAVPKKGISFVGSRSFR